MKNPEYSTDRYKAARHELLRDSPTCHWCHRNPATELDHLVEVDRGGSLEDGYVASCKPCNSARGAIHRNRKLANIALSLSVIFNMVVNLFFYSAKCLVYLSVVFFVVAADLANERHQYKEAPTDNRNHNFSRHVISLPLAVLVAVGRKTRRIRRAWHQR